MIQRIIAFFLLLSHINGNMLLPQLEEKDLYCNGQQVDDINSAVEYLEQEILDIPDESPEDEDDDRGGKCSLLKIGNENCETNFRSYQMTNISLGVCQVFFEHESNKLLILTYDTITPPPKC